MRVDTNELAVELVQDFEGLRLNVYLDSAGLPTVGYGHLIRPVDNLQTGDSITQEQATAFLEDDLADATKTVRRLVGVPINDEQEAALISLTFNIGGGAFANSTLLRKLNRGDYAGAADEFLRWNKAGGRVVQGLINRRKAEREIFLSGTNTGAASEANTGGLGESTSELPVHLPTEAAPQVTQQTTVNYQPSLLEQGTDFIQASTGSVRRLRAFQTSTITNAALAVVAWLADNWWIVLICLIIGGVTIYYLKRSQKTDEKRIDVAADPNKLNAR